jgi:hypothetical protein
VSWWNLAGILAVTLYLWAGFCLALEVDKEITASFPVPEALRRGLAVLMLVGWLPVLIAGALTGKSGEGK